MQSRAAFRSRIGLTCFLTASVADAVPPLVGPAPNPQSFEVMLYFSHPLGGRGGGFKLPDFSVRLNQAHMGGNLGNPNAGDPLQHHELLRLEVAGRQDAAAPDMRFTLGRHMTYDVSHRAFDVHPEEPKSTVIAPALIPGHGGYGFQPTRPMGPRAWETNFPRLDSLTAPWRGRDAFRKPAEVIPANSAKPVRPGG